MNQQTTKYCCIHLDSTKAIDEAVWLNFLVRRDEVNPFSVIDGPDDDYVVVSPDILKEFENPETYALTRKYTEMGYWHIQEIRRDIAPLLHWERICGLFAVADSELLQFIIKHKVPLERLVRYELSIRGFDQNNLWRGFERSKTVWQEEKYM